MYATIKSYVFPLAAFLAFDGLKGGEKMDFNSVGIHAGPYGPFGTYHDVPCW